ncbi:zinc ABC transporter substrate-binding protein [Pseudodonghicola flavimaris]|uniref:High-affinity zinc uptake system protein ZnuA n=1 Tax=Pseudodonghicola flavimaris TaxID=3050036 RepID=A0ABT7EYY9_9RHOB|nr:zinc ABC transporter substrate-binding protein [Pseudodonghicola flavimaris]MDK3017539.1 zinc ABC transporter substrate-binding protein [Pseudodonghicola flavimaris]
MSKLPLIAALAAAGALPAWAEVPRVVTDIAPVHSLTAQVMKGLGEPVLLVQPGQSPHSYALRPSQARALQEAGLVVWVGHALTPWLEKPLDALAEKAETLELLDGDGTIERPYRGAADIMAAVARMEQAQDDHDDHGHDDHDHGDHDGHDHEAAMDDDGHNHDHNGADPHAWLDPENGKVWLGLIAEELAELDPEHAATYRANAAEGQARIDAIETQLKAEVAPMRGVPFVSYHDAFQYFELRYGLQLTGRVTASDASDPSPAHLDALRDRLGELGVRCAFTEPQFDTRLLSAAIAGRDIPILELDPLGRSFEPGPDLYPQLLEAVGGSFAACAATLK